MSSYCLSRLSLSLREFYQPCHFCSSKTEVRAQSHFSLSYISSCIFGSLSLRKLTSILFLLVDYSPQNFPVLLGLWGGTGRRWKILRYSLQSSKPLSASWDNDQDGAKKEKGNYVSEQNTVLGTLQNLYDLHYYSVW